MFRNFIDVTDKLRRDPQHVLQFLLKELGAPGNVEGRRAVFKAKISPNQINDKIQMYTETYVICSECGLPDTKMIKDGRTGDGVGKFHDYLVVVPGTVKGAKIHAKISKISAKTAFAVPTTEACTR